MASGPSLPSRRIQSPHVSGEARGYCLSSIQLNAKCNHPSLVDVGITI